MSMKNMKSEDLRHGGVKKWSKRKKFLVTVLTALPVLLLAGWLTVYLLRPKAPDPTKMEQKDAVKYMASKQFGALPEKEKEDYMAKMRSQNNGSPRFFFNNDLSREEREALRRNTRPLMQKQMKARMNKFFTMSKADQQAELDRILNEMEARRAQRRAQQQAQGNNAQQQRGQGGGGPGGGGRPGGGGNPGARMQQMLEGTDSTTRAQMSEFRKMMRQRAQQRQATAAK